MFNLFQHNGQIVLREPVLYRNRYYLVNKIAVMALRYAAKYRGPALPAE
jgi:hypothetical protein